MLHHSPVTGFRSAPRCAAAVALALLGWGATGCQEKTVAPADRGLDYYPVAVNNYWIYAVADSSYSQASQGQPSSTLTVTNFQFRETVTNTFTDAAGQLAYRVVRAKRLTPAAAWVDDSVFTISATPQTVVMTRNNLKTVELIFPVRDEHLWNFNAYNNNTRDTILAETRRYRRIGQPFSTTAGTPQTYPVTVTTTNEGTAKQEDVYYMRTYRQVYAKGVGPVFRQRRRFNNYYESNGPTVRFYPGAYFFGFSRTETLVDYGPR